MDGGHRTCQVVGSSGPFTLFVGLLLIVPVLVYAAVPLTLAVPCVQRIFRRSGPLPTSEPWRTLDEGLGLFMPREDPPAVSAEARAAIDSLELRLEALRVAATRDRAEIRALRGGCGVARGGIGRVQAAPAANQEQQHALRPRGGEGDDDDDDVTTLENYGHRERACNQ